MIIFTEQEYFDYTGTNLSEVLPKDADSKQASRFIIKVCKDVDKFIRRYNAKLFFRGYDNLTEYQSTLIKEACIEHALFVYNTGSYLVDENGMPKKIPVSDEVKDILRPLLYRGL